MVSFLKKVISGGDIDEPNPKIPRPAPSALVLAPSLVDPEIWGSLNRLERRFVEDLRQWSSVRSGRGREIVRSVPYSLRGLAWRQITGSLPLERSRRGEYEKYAKADPVPFDDVIQKDLVRTNVERRSAEDQKKLGRMLHAYAVMNSELGYCQGMSYVFALCLDVTGGENEAFWLFSQLVDRHALAGFWTEGLPLVQLCLYCMDRMVDTHLPHLFSHFKELGVTPLLYASSWFSSLFTYGFPPILTMKIWDVFLVEGIAYLLKVSMAILKVHHDKLLPLGFEQCIDYLKAAPQTLNSDLIIKAADEMTFITGAYVCSLKDEFNHPAMEEERTLL